MSGHLKSKLTNSKIIILYYIIVLLLTSYGIYKNGIILYQKHLIDFIHIFKPLILVLLSLFITYGINYIYHNNIKKDKYDYKEDYTPIFMTLITLSLPLNTSIILFVFIMIIVNILKLFYNIEFINYYNLAKILFILVLFIIGKYSYLTLYDTNIETNLTSMDLFLGKGVGALATSNILLIIICYFIMLLNESYKKEIPLISIISYIIALIVFDIIVKNNVVLDIKNLLTNGFIFGVIFIATIPMFSPIKYKKTIIYSILIGVISFIINKIFNIYDSIFIAIFITNIIIVIYELLERRIINGHKRI